MYTRIYCIIRSESFYFFSPPKKMWVAIIGRASSVISCMVSELIFSLIFTMNL